MSIVEIAEWEKFVKTHPDAHLLQTASWGELKSQFGWEAVRVLSPENLNFSTTKAGAQILFRKIAFGFSLAYIPKGPIWKEPSRSTWNELDLLWPEVETVCREKKTIFLVVEPDLYEGDQAESDSGREANGEAGRLQRQRIGLCNRCH